MFSYIPVNELVGNTAHVDLHDRWTHSMHIIQVQNLEFFLCPWKRYGEKSTIRLHQVQNVITEGTACNRGVKSYLERAGVGAGFYSHQAESTPKSIESQDQLIKQEESGVAQGSTPLAYNKNSLFLGYYFISPIQKKSKEII